jgi:UDP-N-acetylmuramyl pentapeptide synthase
LHEYLENNTLEGKIILLKGSRSTRMEKLLDVL